MDAAPQSSGFGEDDHGIAGWPHDPVDDRAARPPRLPDGAPWPRIDVLILRTSDGPGLAATLASVEGQAYPECRCGMAQTAVAAGSLDAILADAATDFLLLLNAGDLLAPGALAALALDASLTGADVVAGLRVLFDRGVLGLDVLARPPTGPRSTPVDSDAPVIGGDLLLARDAVVRAGGIDLSAADPVADLWRRLSGSGARLSRIGRPVLLQHVPAGREAAPAAPAGLSIVALTDGGYVAGAGIAHRRISEALTLAGHRLTHLRLSGESPAAAAEWTDAFPMTEAAILAGGHDLVLAGNLHGATRSTRLLARLGRHLPVAAILHDLFPLTGRCAFPKGCPLIETGCDAGCPTPDQYPQLAPDRIAGAYADKYAVLAEPGAPLLLANSEWTALTARAMAPKTTDLARIDLAFPSGVFRPGDRTMLRRRLGLPQDDVLVMFGAVIADAPGKGFADLRIALALVARPGIGFVAVGRLDDPKVFGLPNLVSTGPVGDEATLAEWYGACDIYVTGSQTETLGQTPIEAGLCGIPTVAYRSCGLTTAVMEGVSGLLADTRPEALAGLLSDLAADAPRRRHLGAWGRIALENRNSYAAAAMRMHEVLAERGLLARASGAGRQRFSPDLLGQFAFAKNRYAGSRGTLPPMSHPVVRGLRMAKQAVFGRGMPLWLRRVLYAASLVRRRSGWRQR